MPDKLALIDLLEQVRACRSCEAFLPHTPRPVIQVSESARLLIIGQAPGTKVHASGIPWDDRSGERLREWMGVTPEVFYDQAQIAIVPMGFCYPGKGSSGDLPPRTECAPKWHADLYAGMPNIQLTLLIGQYAQRYYLRKQVESLTQTVKNWETFLPEFLPLPHPSPRNQAWRKYNPWFEAEVVPALQALVKKCLRHR